MVKYQFTSQDAEEQINLNTKFQEVILRQAKVIEQLQQDNDFLKQQIKELTLQLENTDCKQIKQITQFKFNEDQKQEASIDSSNQLEKQIVQKNQGTLFNSINTNTTLQQPNEPNFNQNLDNLIIRFKTASNQPGNLFHSNNIFQDSPGKNQQLNEESIFGGHIFQQLQNKEQFNQQQPQQQQNLFSNDDQPQSQNSNLIEFQEEEIQFFGAPSKELKIFLKNQNEFQEKVEQSKDIDKLSSDVQLINNNSQEQNQQPELLNDSSQNPNLSKMSSDKEVEILQPENMNQGSN
ncbi:unnamed protein product [Paramecium sonneborni]|uniref:Uncharacterized protein n=1 Tax=Paramecium sonneborni TaxID=65129 RepID=A0A8S1KBY8_9CILI|nr:unnamed protein product [Paramecium sonneborni]